MMTSESDFDAAKAVADQLKGLDKERQQRVLRWVAESLNLDLGAVLGTPPPSSELRHQDATGEHISHSNRSDSTAPRTSKESSMRNSLRATFSSLPSSPTTIGLKPQRKVEKTP